MALSQPHPPEGTRDEPEGLNPSIAECGAHIKSKVRERQRGQTQRGERRGSPRWSCYLCQVNQQAVIYIRASCPAHELSLTGMERAPCCQAVTLLLGQ